MYAETASFVQSEKVVHEQVVVELRKGTSVERIVPRDPDTAFEFHAIHDDLLLVQGTTRDSRDLSLSSR